jgi:MFS family permease
MADNKATSMRALDALNFCNAGIQTGLGPFMSIFYTAVRHWDPGKIGILLGCQALVGVLIQAPVGNMVDNSHHKRLITAIAAVTVALGAAGIAIFPGYGLQIVMQLVIGLSVTVFPTATSAFALGMSEEKDIAGRVARNETSTHIGNSVFAVVAGVLGSLIALVGIFYAAAAFAVGMAISVMFIAKDQVNHDAARRGGEEDEQGKEKKPQGIRDLIQDKRILIFTAAVVLFNVSNAATLPLIGEILSKDQNGSNQHGSHAAWQIAAAVFVAEAVMIGVAAYSGKKAENWGRKPLFLIAFAFLAARNGLNLASHQPFYLIGLQALDGVAGAIYGVLLTLVTSDLAKGTGRFNLLQGAIQSTMGLGAFVSNIGFGFVAKSLGFNVAFAGLGGFAVAGGLLYQYCMPETRQQDQEESKKDKTSEGEPAAKAGEKR